MDFKDLIRTRRSMRKFTDEKVTEAEVKMLLRAALMSPSSKSIRNWNFVVVDDKETIKQLAHCKKMGA
ncbi:MAG: nitroreductase family protein, partial [Bacteroidaceae bacterium]|nr:nitroreductase family protein [Bacteroidaceae bacterium]